MTSNEFSGLRGVAYSARQDLHAVPVLIGPFPRPFHRGGVSTTNAKLATMLAAREIDHACIDLATDFEGRGPAYHWSRLKRAAKGFARIVFAPGPRRYAMSVDGDWGLAYNILHAAAARLRGSSVLLYHHSTSYVLSNSLLMRVLLAVAGKETIHITCSRRMFDLYRDRYDIPDKALILSNAAWISPSPVPQSPPDPDTITLGYLGMLSEEKGVLRALDTFKELKRRGVRAKIKIAGGGISQEVTTGIERAQSEFGADVALLGTISDTEKWEFFATLDYFLFPTLYPHETQSSVAPEAMSAGVPVIAYDHRFVGEMIGADGGLLVPTSLQFTNAAADWIESGATAAERLERRSRAREHYKEIYAKTAQQLETLITILAAPR